MKYQRIINKIIEEEFDGNLFGGFEVDLLSQGKNYIIIAIASNNSELEYYYRVTNSGYEELISQFDYA